MAICDDLNSTIKGNESTAQHFADAVVAEMAA
jgi:hypothetical protein